MKIGSDEEYVEIEKLERNPEGAPCAGDVKVRVALCLQAFSGSHRGVWFALPEMERFISELEMLDAKRSGSARILSMSPGEFALEIRASGPLGHMEMEVQLQRRQYSGPRCWPTYLKGGFEAKPETARQLVSCFKALAN